MKATQTILVKIAIPIAAIILALIIGGIVIITAGKNPFEAYGYLIIGAFGSVNAFAETLVKATPLILTAMAAVFAYRCGMLNLGIDGQLVMGSIAAVLVGTQCTFGPGILRIILCVIAAMAAGGLWALIPGVLKALYNINEMIVGILLNYIATWIMAYLYSGPLMEERIPQTAQVAEDVKLYRFIPPTRAHVGIFVAIAVTLLVYYFLFHTYKGYQLRAVGLNKEAARINGFAVKRYMVLSFVASGAIAGMAGCMELLGASYRLQAGFAEGFGFDGVAIALIAMLHPLGAMLVAYLFAVLRCGANAMQVASGISTAVVDIIQGIIIIFAVAGSALVVMPEIKAFFAKRRRKGNTEQLSKKKEETV